ncbi:MAG: hypothetical protein ACPL7O_10125, partial [Armatimonadota bacterium]
AKSVSSLSEVFKEPIGSAVQVPGLILNAGAESFTSRCYAQQQDRATGTCIILSSGAAPLKGTMVTVTGKVGRIDGERVLLDAYLQPTGVPGEPAALGLSGRALTSANLSTQGLLVEIWGTVSHVAPDRSFFTVDDGSGLTDGMGHPGIRVVCDGNLQQIAPPAQGAVVTVKGISGCENDGSLPVIRPRLQSDIIVILH